MPPGGFRLAVVNGFDLAAALSARTRLEDHFVERRMCLVRYADDRKATVGRDHVEAALQLPKLGQLARACARARQCVAVP